MPRATHYRGGSGITVVKVLYWLAVFAAIWFAYMNVLPYVRIAKIAMLQTMDSSLNQLIASIPLVNGLIFAFLSVIHWFIGATLFLIIQTLEILPTVLRRDRAFLRTLINHSDSSDKFDIQEDDEPTLATLKLWYNQFPSLTIARARTASLFVYAVDFCICIAVYPPAPGGFSNFIFLISTGQLGRLDWQNILMLGLTLFAIEGIVRLLFWLGEIAYFMKSAHAPQS
ncbi:hypothetical protein NDI44_27220 [Trichocoleus sp. DQ-A3]|uniref:hypothetical protein n=1 Tax=Cyanophyceae TaxID=3028117 RepID=UPI001683254F|nr:hypothetical protein [Coleofasciculus sp. FACHB-125]MBD1903878.1 hypothetical protein [Coleofasciculus sp. FACHB-125]